MNSMHRKGTEGMAIETASMSVYWLIVLAVGIILITVLLAGKGTELMNKARAAISGMGSCEDVGTVDFQTFMAKMKEIHNECVKKESACGSASCKTMSLDLGPTGTYHEIGSAVLKDYEMDYFNSYLLFILDETKVFCEREGLRTSDEINVYYEETTYVRERDGRQIYTDNSKKTLICDSYAGGIFAVADGSKIEIMAINHKDPIFGISKDLKLEISGGQFTKPEPAPSAPECTISSKCQPPDWGDCVNNHCKYDYCQRIDILPNCNAFSVTCKMGNCVDPPTTSCNDAGYFKSNNFKTRINKLLVDVDTKWYVQGDVTLSSGTTRTFGIKIGEEQWFKDDFLSPKTGSNDPDAKVSLAFESIMGPDGDGNYIIGMRQGCY